MWRSVSKVTDAEKENRRQEAERTAAVVAKAISPKPCNIPFALGASLTPGVKRELTAFAGALRIEFQSDEKVRRLLSCRAPSYQVMH